MRYSVVKYDIDRFYSAYKINSFKFNFQISGLSLLTSQAWAWSSGGEGKWEMNWEGDWHRGPTLISNLTPQGHMKAPDVTEYERHVEKSFVTTGNNCVLLNPSNPLILLSHSDSAVIFKAVARA